MDRCLEVGGGEGRWSWREWGMVRELEMGWDEGKDGGRYS